MMDFTTQSSASTQGSKTQKEERAKTLQGWVDNEINL